MVVFVIDYTVIKNLNTSNICYQYVLKEKQLNSYTLQYNKARTHEPFL